MKYLLLLCIFVAGCNFTPPIKIDENDAKAKAAITITILGMEDNVSVIPEPNLGPVNGKCENCNGTGKVSDHNGASAKCPVCNGTGKVTRKTMTEEIAPKVPEIKQSFPQATERKKEVIGTLFFYHAEWCAPCKKWNAELRTVFEKMDISVIDMEYPESGVVDAGNGKNIEIQAIPFFVYKSNSGKSFWNRGYLTLERFKELTNATL